MEEIFMVDKVLDVYNNLTKQNDLKVDNKEAVLGEVVAEMQNDFIKSDFGNAVNSALDVGIRVLCPDIIEDQVINLKNNILNHGLIDGLGKTVEDALEFGKSIIGVVTNGFESLFQAKSAISAGDAVGKVSNLLDSSIDNLKNSEKIDSETANSLKSGKETIAKNIENNIEKTFEKQMKDMSKLEKYISNWNKAFNNRDFSGMEKEFNKMKKVMNSLLPLESTLSDYRTIENLQYLIESNGQNFDLSIDELELANKLIH